MALQWARLPQANRLYVVRILGQVLMRRLLGAGGREVGREDS